MDTNSASLISTSSSKKSSYTCPVCGKPLTENEYLDALGLWEEKQEHIKHLEAERKKLQDQAIKDQKRVADQMKALRAKEKAFKAQTDKLQKDLINQQKKSEQDLIKERAQTQKKLQDLSRKSEQQIQLEKKNLQKKELDFAARQAKLQNDLKMQGEKAEKALAAERALTLKKLAQQKTDLQRELKQKQKELQKQLQAQLKQGIEAGVEQQKKELQKQAVKLRQSQNKMAQLEKSLKLSAEKYQQASSEIKRLKEQIEKGITPQIEGLLEEGNLLAKLQQLFPNDRFDHPGKGGDIIHHVCENNNEIGIIVYECKKVKTFSKNHIEQAKVARRQRQADFAILVTNAFPAKKQYYFVEKTVFVISPINLEPIVHTLRDSLVRMYVLRLSSEAKSKAVQEVYNYLSSNEYSNRVNDMTIQLVELGKDLKSEMATHKRIWQNRYKSYQTLYDDLGSIDLRLRSLINLLPGNQQKLLPPPRYIEIDELDH